MTMGDDSQNEGGKTFNLTGGFSEDAGRMLPPSRYFAPGTLLAGNYVVESVIGEGGMGIVYRAIDTTLNRPVAVKTLHSNLLGDKGIRRRFVREARL
ncbi:MAG: serine/threonine protein kinase, partial [Myxococcota bacterium]